MLFENSPVSIWEEDFSGVKALFNDLRKEGVGDIATYFAQHPETVRQCAELVKIVNLNHAALALHGAASKEELLAGLVNTFTPESFHTFQQELVCLWNGGTEVTLDAVVKTLAGEPRNVTVYFSVSPGYEETLAKVIVSLVDITERRKAEQERLANLKFFESMDKVNRAILGTNNLEQMMRRVLDTTLSIFDCDRAWLFYPCDPDAPLFRVPMEISKPEYPGAGVLNVDVPMPPDMAMDLRETLESPVPVTYAAGTERPINQVSGEQFGVKSMMMAALHPKSGKPWAFGLHQCSYPRTWTPEEQRLFQEIGRRLADALTVLLTYRDLRESEEKYRRLVDTASEGILVLGKDFLISFVNARMADLLGYKAMQMIGRPLTAFMFDEDIPDHLRRMKNRQQGQSDYYERRYHHKNGQVVWTLVSATPIMDAEQNFNGTFGMFTDITERKQAEEQVRESELRLHTIWDAEPECVQLVSHDGLLLDINPAGLVMLDVDHQEDIIGKPFIESIATEHRERFLAIYRQALRDGSAIGEYECIGRKGSRRWVETHAVPLIDEKSKTTMILSVTRDITERKRNEEALEKSETFIRNILESVGEGFIVVDRQYRILSANRAFCHQTNLPVDQVVGRFCYEVSHQGTQPCFELGEECGVRRTCETGIPHNVTHMHSDSAGEKKYIETKSYPLTDASGQVVAAIETMTDVTEKKRLEAQLQHAQKMEAIGTLAGGVAHDFNNILTAIIGYGNIAKINLKSDDPQQESLDQILLAAERAAQLTKGLLAFSRKQIIKIQPLDLNEVIKNVDKMLLRLIGEDIVLTSALTATSLVVKADAGQLEQILMNLATNARDAMPNGGAITISTQLIDLTEHFVDAHGFGKPGEYALVTVTDTGMGIDAKTREKIFEPFFTTKESGHGTGLGLSIVYGIIKQHEGYIIVTSEPGKGTTFAIYLPLIAQKKQDEVAEIAAPPSGGNETILLAEDDQDVRNLTQLILHDFGYHVITAVDGQDALDKFSRHAGEIDLLILDVIMPRKSGKEVYDAVKAARPDLPVLFVSGYTSDILNRRGIFEEGLQFMSKPITPNDLIRKISDILDTKRRT